jgi:predicted N-acetyltransferase YhbS
MKIERLENYDSFVGPLATAQFELWGALTGRDSLGQYKALLRGAGKSNDLLTSFVAVEDNRLLGSVNLVENDLPVHSHLAPWLAQLYVFPESRCMGVGAALIRAAVDEARRLNRPKLYLYCSGTLPQYYKKLGWHRTEALDYQGKTRIIMEIAT